MFFNFLKELKSNTNTMATFFCPPCESVKTSQQVMFKILLDNIHSVNLKINAVQPLITNKQTSEIYASCKRDIRDLQQKYLLTAHMQIQPTCSNHCFQCQASSTLCSYHEFENLNQIERH